MKRKHNMSNDTRRTTLHSQQKHTETEQDGVTARTRVNRAGLASFPCALQRGNKKNRRTCTDNVVFSRSLSSPVSPCHLFERRKAGKEEAWLLCRCTCVCACELKSLVVSESRPSILWGRCGGGDSAHSVMLMSLGGAWPAVGCECSVVAVAARFT